MFCKLNSVTYNKFILKKLSLKDNQKPSFTILKHVVFLFNLFMFFIYFILNEYEVFHIAEAICAPEEYSDNTIWSAHDRKIFADAAKISTNDAIAKSCWNILPNNNSLILTISRQKFLALKAHHVELRSPLNDIMDFTRIPTRHRTNLRDIMGATSPNYICVIRHYTNLRSSTALQAEYNFLSNVKYDPHINDHKCYANTFHRHILKFKQNPNSLLENYELEYLNYLSETLNHSKEEKKMVQEKYITGRFYGKFLDFTGF